MSAHVAGCAFHPRCEYRTQACAAEHPALDLVERGHAVRCHRWRELGEVTP
jgi:peptide/nickel transport system ATP-binding protein